MSEAYTPINELGYDYAGGDFKHVSQVGSHFRAAGDDETVRFALGLFCQLVRTLRTAQPEGDRLGQGRHAHGRGWALRGATAKGTGEQAPDFRRLQMTIKTALLFMAIICAADLVIFNAIHNRNRSLKWHEIDFDYARSHIASHTLNPK
jgi:hypothetical protein